MVENKLIGTVYSSDLLERKPLERKIPYIEIVSISPKHP